MNRVATFSLQLHVYDYMYLNFILDELMPWHKD